MWVLMMILVGNGSWEGGLDSLPLWLQASSSSTVLQFSSIYHCPYSEGEGRD